MRDDRKDSPMPASDKNAGTQEEIKDNTSASASHRDAKPDSPETRPSRTEQERKDLEEKHRHPASENTLDSTLDKNPIPPGSTRK